MKITIDLSEWEDPSSLQCGEAVLDSTIKALTFLQDKGVCPVPNDGTNPVEWLKDILYLVHDINQQILAWKGKP